LNRRSFTIGTARYRLEGQIAPAQLFASLGWAVNELTEDYGRDFEVEVFRGKSTGITFGSPAHLNEALR
jgi:hypothetical protein